jgi:hypothetical protein
MLSNDILLNISVSSPYLVFKLRCVSKLVCESLYDNTNIEYVKKLYSIPHDLTSIDPVDAIAAIKLGILCLSKNTLSTIFTRISDLRNSDFVSEFLDIFIEVRMYSMLHSHIRQIPTRLICNEKCIISNRSLLVMMQFGVGIPSNSAYQAMHCIVDGDIDPMELTEYVYPYHTQRYNSWAMEAHMASRVDIVRELISMSRSRYVSAMYEASLKPGFEWRGMMTYICPSDMGFIFVQACEFGRDSSFGITTFKYMMNHLITKEAYVRHWIEEGLSVACSLGKGDLVHLILDKSSIRADCDNGRLVYKAWKSDNKELARKLMDREDAPTTEESLKAAFRLGPWNMKKFIEFCSS